MKLYLIYENGKPLVDCVNDMTAEAFGMGVPSWIVREHAETAMAEYRQFNDGLGVLTLVAVELPEDDEIAGCG